MDTPHSDLEAIRQILADLTTRVYRIERKLHIDAPSVETRRASAVEPSIPGPFAEASSVPMQAETQVPRVPRDDSVGPSNNAARDDSFVREGRVAREDRAER